MTRYDDMEPCEACGNYAHLLEFVPWQPLAVFSTARIPAYLRVECMRCGYKWQRAPLNQKDN